MCNLFKYCTVSTAFRNAVDSRTWPTCQFRWCNQVDKMFQMPVPIPHTMLTQCIQNCNWQFHLYFLKLQAIILCLFLPIYFLFSFGMAGDDRKRKHGKPKGPPKPQTVGASHREKDVNQWKENDMKMCIEEYKRQWQTILKHW